MVLRELRRRFNWGGGEPRDWKQKRGAGELSRGNTRSTVVVGKTRDVEWFCDDGTSWGRNAAGGVP